MSELSGANLIASKIMGTITLNWLKDYARVSGDHNPIHQDEKIAKAMGLPGVIAHGMLVSGLLHSRAQEALYEVRDLRGFEIKNSKTRFRAMTLLGDEITVGGQWQILSNTEVKLDLTAKNLKGETLVTGAFKLIRPEPTKKEE